MNNETVGYGGLPLSFLNQLDRILDRFNGKAHGRNGKARRECSVKTRHDREKELKHAFAQLREMGYRLPSPTAIKRKHLYALAKRWQEQGLATRTLHTRFSMLRVFCRWIGKGELVGDIGQYFGGREALVRITAGEENKNWTAKGIDIQAFIEKAKVVDERLALYLALQHHFGLRVKESIELQPLRAIEDGAECLWVSHGTKGGLPRYVPVETAEQRAVLDWALRVARTARSKRLRWPRLTWTQAQARFYRTMKQLGATRDGLGITAHGLRHGYAQRSYRRETGLPTPIEGGALGRIDYKTHLAASLTVSATLGHSRAEVTNAYYGTYGHALRATKAPRWT